MHTYVYVHVYRFLGDYPTISVHVQRVSESDKGEGRGEEGGGRQRLNKYIIVSQSLLLSARSAYLALLICRMRS